MLQDIATALKEKLTRSTGKAWEYYETISDRFIVREDDGDDAGPLAHFESADDAAFVCSAKNVVGDLLLRLELAERRVEQYKNESRVSIGEVWHWGGDEEDHLESLTCPILISPEKMRIEIEKAKAEFVRKPLLDLLSAARGIRDIGKRDMTNPKYDGYFTELETSIKATEKMLDRKLDV